MKLIVSILASLLISASIMAQVAPNKYFVKFTDKNNSPYSVDEPSAYLSQRAIERRQAQNIPVDQTDLPVNPSYLAGVAAEGATLLNPTKWLNGVTIFTDDLDVVQAIEQLPYVEYVSIYPAPQTEKKRFEKPFFANEEYLNAPGSSLKNATEHTAFNYGDSFNQIHMLEGDQLHEMGYMGQGMVIAVLDAGFLNVDIHPAFDSLWMNAQILGTHDFVDGGYVTFDKHFHGAMVLSTIGGNTPGELIGTAPKASFWLLRSEDGDTEYIIEEYNWVSAAEFADSAGADVINSSLGYTVFDNPSQDHTYADMDGNTTPITIGADYAAKKGMIVCNSAGNEGSSSWYYLSAPSDGDSVMGIGAVDWNGDYVSFSSHGPSYDGRVKPDVAAQGAGVIVADPFSLTFGSGSGTSFSSPIMAGMSAILWQANPDQTNVQIMDAIRQSGSQYLFPDDELGYGIPDFIMAFNILTLIESPDITDHYLQVYPNPFIDKLAIQLDDNRPGSVLVTLTDLSGRTMVSRQVQVDTEGACHLEGLENIAPGIYFLSVEVNGKMTNTKLIKR